MQNLLFSLNATMPVFFVMVVGYLLGQAGFLPPAFCKAADKLCFKVTLPVMLFLDMGSVDILHDFQPRFVLFCFAATLVGILAVWAGAKRFLKHKALVGEFVQAGYRSSAAVLGVRNQLKKIETELDKKRARYDELMELMASEELYADQDKFNAALGEYNGLKQELPKLEDEWLELSTQIEEETARELS